MATHQYRRFIQIGVTVISALLLGVCYLFAPLAVILLAHRLLPLIGALIAIPAIPAIWFLPTVCSLVLLIVLWSLAGEKTAVYRGWAFGVLLGATMLSAVWFLPLWEDSWPAAAAVLSPFRVSGLFENAWLTGLSWLVAVPIMVYANLEGAFDGIETPKTGGQQSIQSESEFSVQSTTSTRSVAPTDTQRPDSSTVNLSSEDLTYRWDVAPDVRFADVGGMNEVKSEIERSVLRPLMSTDAVYERFNISPPNGILLYGPPGTGKTHFARAVAGELGHPYLELSAGDLKSQWINESTEKVTQLFREAEQFERCVIFIDEIDALLAERGNNLHQEHAQVVNEFLAQLDAEEPNFLLIAATNQVELLDEAATRRGRFDQQYEIGLPNREEREAIFRVRLRDMPTQLDKQDYQELAVQSEGLSSAEIIGVIEDGAVHAAEREADALERDDVFLAMRNLE